MQFTENWTVQASSMVVARITGHAPAARAVRVYRSTIYCAGMGGTASVPLHTGTQCRRKEKQDVCGCVRSGGACLQCIACQAQHACAAAAVYTMHRRTESSGRAHALASAMNANENSNVSAQRQLTAQRNMVHASQRHSVSGE